MQSFCRPVLFFVLIFTYLLKLIYSDTCVHITITYYCIFFANIGYLANNFLSFDANFTAHMYRSFINFYKFKFLRLLNIVRIFRLCLSSFSFFLFFLVVLVFSCYLIVVAFSFYFKIFFVFFDFFTSDFSFFFIGITFFDGSDCIFNLFIYIFE